MTLPNPFKVQKLTITALKLGDGKDPNPNMVFEAMFNPSQYAVTHENVWDTPPTLTPNAGVKPADNPGASAITDTSTKTPDSSAPSSESPIPNNPLGTRFLKQKQGNFAVKLILDGTGVSEFGLSTITGLTIKSVEERVKQFLKVCQDVVEEKHHPNKVEIKWGSFIFKGYLDKVTINYTLFDPSGKPLRAELDVSFIFENEVAEVSSPDLTHYREIHEGDTLPLLSREIYGTSRHYLLVAAANRLDDFRHLTTGMKLYFPPLENGI